MAPHARRVLPPAVCVAYTCLLLTVRNAIKNTLTTYDAYLTLWDPTLVPPEQVSNNKRARPRDDGDNSTNKKPKTAEDYGYTSKAAQRTSGKSSPQPTATKESQQARKLKAVWCFEHHRARGKTVKEATTLASEASGYSQTYIPDILQEVRKVGVDEACRDRLPGSGPPSKMTPGKVKILEDLSKETKGDFTYRDAAKRLFEKGKEVVPATIRRFVKAFWIVCKPRITPILTKENAAERKQWALDHVDDTWENKVDVDEKWFYSEVKTSRKKLKFPNKKSRKGMAGNKRHVVKVMYLIAVARPVPERDFDGKIGCWRITESKTAKRKTYKKGRKANGVLREKGDVFEEDCTMNSKVYQKMYKEKLLPAIKQKMHWAKRVVVQHDGATPHTGKGTEDILKQAGKNDNANEQQIELVRQPPNSPDMNVLDLCFNRALACMAAKTRPRTKDEIAKAVELAWEQYEWQRLERAWKYKSFMLKAVVEYNGWNNFPLPHYRDEDENGKVTEVGKLTVDDVPEVVDCTDSTDEESDSDSDDNGSDGDADDEDEAE